MEQYDDAKLPELLYGLAALRLLHGAPVNRLIDVNLIDPDHSGIAPQTNDFSALNPGYVPVRAGE